MKKIIVAAFLLCSFGACNNNKEIQPQNVETERKVQLNEESDSDIGGGVWHDGK